MSRHQAERNASNRCSDRHAEDVVSGGVTALREALIACEEELIETQDKREEAEAKMEKLTLELAWAMAEIEALNRRPTLSLAGDPLPEAEADSA